VQRRLLGDDWKEIGRDLNMSEEQAEEAIQGIEFPCGGSLRRKRSRKIRCC
jgi:hypothetical protein